MRDWDGVRLGGTPQRVTRLDLDENALTGSIPEELGRLSRLRELLLDRNALTGELLEELGNLTQLRNLYVADSQLTGAIPQELASLPNLTILILGGNSFTGCIPAGLRDVDTHDLDTLGLADCATRRSPPSRRATQQEDPQPWRPGRHPPPAGRGAPRRLSSRRSAAADGFRFHAMRTRCGPYGDFKTELHTKAKCKASACVIL